MKKIPIMLLKNKKKNDRFLALGIEHIDYDDPEGDVLICDVENAFVIVRKDLQAPTLEDLESIRQESEMWKNAMKKRFGEDAVINYDVTKWLEEYGPYSHEVDIATYNLIALNSEFVIIGDLLQVEKGDLVQLAPFDVPPTLENVVLVEEGLDKQGSISIYGKNIDGCIPGTIYNIKKVPGVQRQKGGTAEHIKFTVKLVPKIQEVHRCFSDGWKTEKGILFNVDEFRFNAVVEYPYVVVSEVESGAKLKRFFTLIQEEQIDDLLEWIEIEPVEYIASVLEKVGKEAFKNKVEKYLATHNKSLIGKEE